MAGPVRVTIQGTERFKAKLRGLHDACSSREAKEISMAGGEVIASYAKMIVHVITGDLRRSIRVEPASDGTADVIAGGINGVDYAPYEEFGTRFRSAHPYMRPALDAGRSEARTAMRRKVYTLIRRVARE